MTDKEKIRAEVKRRREIHRKTKRIESAFEDNAILFERGVEIGLTEVTYNT